MVPQAMANISKVPGQKQMILVTAYYSPLPNQSVYIRGSYQADIILNGRGTNGADGTEVYVGMIAAPKSYPFGTRVRIPGLGVGEVHDRGGAILARKNYDRIDVWMGHGEEGLARALNWGARLVEGEVFWNPHQVEPGLDYSWVSSQMPAKLLNRRIQNPQVFKKDISTGSAKKDIKALQEALTSLGYYNGPITGTFGKITKDSLVLFQTSEGVISSANSAGAGHFGPKTRAKLKVLLEDYNKVVRKEIKRLEQNRTLLASGLGKRSSGDEVETLQQMLWEMGYYRGEIHGKYDAITIDAVYDFQLDHGVIKSEWDKGAGFYGKKTHDTLQNAINKRITVMNDFPMEKQAWTPSNKALPSLEELALEEGASRTIEFASLPVEGEPIKPQILANMDIYDSGQEVKKLQDLLIEKGYLPKGLNTAYFGQKTKKALLKFQLENGIIASEYDTGAGRVGPKTRRILNNLFGAKDLTAS